MKIAFIVPSLANKGPIIVVKELVQQLIANKHYCEVFYLDDIVEIEMLCTVKKISFFKKTNFNNFDIVHSHGVRPDIYVCLHKPIVGHIKFVTTLHNYVIKDFSYQYNKFIAYICGNLWMLSLIRHDKIVVLSKNAMIYYQKWFPLKRLSYVYNTRKIENFVSLPQNEIEKIKKFKGDSILIGINSLLTHRKGVDQVIKSLTKLFDYKLMVIGDGKDLEKLKFLSEKLGVRDRCLFYGYRNEAFRYLEFYDIYAMPSRSEGFPLALLEAALYKVPIVCSDIPVFKEICMLKDVSFFRLEDIDSLASAILYATSNKQMAEIMYQHYINEYSPIKLYNGYMQIYRSTQL